MSLFKRKDDDEQDLELPKNIEEHATQSRRYMLPSLVVAVIGLLASSAVIWLNQSAHNEQQAQQQIESWGAAYTAAINQRIAFMQTDTQSAANNPRLALTLQNNDPNLKRMAEQGLLHRGHTVDAFISQTGHATQDNNRDAPINFAALDLLNRAENGPQPLPEALQVGERWLLYSTAKLVGGVQSPGSLLMMYDAATVFDGLPVFANTELQVELQQQFQNGPLQILYRQGDTPSKGSTHTFETEHPNWTLVIHVPHGFAQQSSLLFILLLAASLAIFFVVFALYWMHRSVQKQLRADAQTLSETMKDWTQGKSIKPLTLNMVALQDFAKHLTHNVEENSGQPVKQAQPLSVDDLASNGESTKATLKALATAPEPAYQPLDMDILDLDLLEDDLDVFGLDEADTATTTAAPNVPNEIFRAYDIRGIVGQTLTTDTAYWIGRAVGSDSIANGEFNVVVGRDGRLSGPDMLHALIQGLLDCGCNVTDIGMVPTPVLYFATHTLEARSGVMVTGSHNPPDYNGFKIVIAGETLASERITALHTRIVKDDLAHGVGSLENLDILNTYLEHISTDIAIAKPLRVVLDCGNGIGGVIAPQLLEAIGCSVIPLYCDVDGSFPNHHPDPSKAENLQDLIARVKSEEADLGIAFDGDADRLGVVTRSGEIISPDHLMMLFSKDVVSRNPGCDVVFDVKCTRRLSALISGYGGRPIMWKSGHSLIKAKMKETGALLGGEMSGHIFFKERWFGFDDVIYSAARLLELVSLDDRDIDEMFAAFPMNPTTPELNVAVTEATKFNIIERLQNEGQWGEASITTLDGVRADYPHGWGLVRASNTTPMLVLRFEGDSTDDLAQIQALFREQLLAIEPDLNLPF